MKKSVAYRSSVELSICPFLARVGVLGSVSRCHLKTSLGSLSGTLHDYALNDLFVHHSNDLHAMLGEIQNLLSVMCDGVFRESHSNNHQNLFCKAQYELKKGFLESRSEHQPHNRSTDFNLDTNPCILCVLYMYRSVTQSWLNICLQVRESAWDSQKKLFKEVIDQARWGLNSRRDISDCTSIFHIGMIPPLYLVSIKCRSYKTRREARDLLKEMSEEIKWLTSPVIKIIDRVIELEEEGFQNLDDALFLQANENLPPEEERLRHLKLIVNERQVYMAWKKSRESDDMAHTCEAVTKIAGPQGSLFTEL